MKRWLSLLLCFFLLLPGAAAEESPAKDRLPDEVLMTYYDHTLFVGDSLIRMLRNYVKGVQKKDPGFFPGVKFYSEYSFQLSTAAREWVQTGSDRVFLTYKGSEATLYEVMKGEKPVRVFLLAGLNDRIEEHYDWAENYLNKIMALTEKHAPGTQIIFFSMTPVTQSVNKKKNRQAKIDAYNAWLEEKCAQIGAGYMNIAEGLKDENGVLPRALSSDGEYHLNEEGNAIWIRELLDYAQAQYEAGLWTPDALK